MYIYTHIDDIMKHIAKLMKSGHTVFSYKLLQEILGISNKNTLKTIVASCIKSKILLTIHPGYRGFSDYSLLEFASKLKSPSYISLETVLQQEGVIFQDYSKQTSLIGNNSITLHINNHNYCFHKMKLELLLNPLGINISKSFSVASKERAICDILYFFPNYFFDNINKLDIKLMKELILLYPKTTQKRIYSIISDYA